MDSFGASCMFTVYTSAFLGSLNGVHILLSASQERIIRYPSRDLLIARTYDLPYNPTVRLVPLPLRCFALLCVALLRWPNHVVIMCCAALHNPYKWASPRNRRPSVCGLLILFGRHEGPSLDIRRKGCARSFKFLRWIRASCLMSPSRHPWESPPYFCFFIF